MKRLVLALLFVSLTACKKDAPSGAAPAPSGSARGKRALSFAVDAIRTEAKKVDYLVTAPGTIEAFERVQVTSRVAGAVDRVSFTEGQEVKKGQTLVSIDAERYRLAVNSARAAVEKALAAQRDVEAMVKRREGASDTHPGLIPGEELETYRTRSLTAKADTAVAAEALKVAELNLRDSSVRAPLGGVIQTRTVETGQYVQPGYVMATLLRQDPMLLRFFVEPQEAPRIKPGMKATFKMRETQRVFTAKITLVAAAADVQTHMVGVTGEVDTGEHAYWLRPGSFCDVTLDIGASREAPLVPRTATRPTDRGYIVYVVEDGLAAEKPVTLGMSTEDGWVEIRSGIKAGDLVVVRGAEALTPGARVKMNLLDRYDPTAEIAPPKRGEGDAGAEEAPVRRGRRDGGATP